MKMVLLSDGELERLIQTGRLSLQRYEINSSDEELGRFLKTGCLPYQKYGTSCAVFENGKRGYLGDIRTREDILVTSRGSSEIVTAETFVVEDSTFPNVCVRLRLLT